MYLGLNGYKNKRKIRLNISDIKVHDHFCEDEKKEGVKF